MKKIDISKYPLRIATIISIILLLIAIPSGLPYGYYTFLRLVVCGTAIFIVYTAYISKTLIWAWVTGLTALLFNPLIPIHLDKDAWVVIDVIVAVLFFVSLFIVKERR